MSSSLDLVDAAVRDVRDEEAGRVRAEIDRRDPAGHFRGTTPVTRVTDARTSAPGGGEHLQACPRARVSRCDGSLELGRVAGAAGALLDARSRSSTARPTCVPSASPNAPARAEEGDAAPDGHDDPRDGRREADRERRENDEQHRRRCYTRRRDAGWSSQVARRAHNPEVAGSNPAPAIRKPCITGAFLVSGSGRAGSWYRCWYPATRTFAPRPSPPRRGTHLGGVDVSLGDRVLRVPGLRLDVRVRLAGRRLVGQRRVSEAVPWP